MDLKEAIRTVPHWPIEGVMFRDITTLLQDPATFRRACDLFYDRYRTITIDKVVGIDARGFIFGSVLAYEYPNCCLEIAELAWAGEKTKMQRSRWLRFGWCGVLDDESRFVILEDDSTRQL